MADVDLTRIPSVVFLSGIMRLETVIDAVEAKADNGNGGPNTPVVDDSAAAYRVWLAK
jgi:hypothetical protein